MVSHHPGKFGDYRHCGSGDICFWLLKRKIPDVLASIRHYCLFLKDMGWKHTTYHIINSDPGHTRSKQQLDKTLKITFASLSRNCQSVQKKWREGKKEKKNYNGNCKAFCVSRKRKKKEIGRPEHSLTPTRYVRKHLIFALTPTPSKWTSYMYHL